MSTLFELLNRTKIQLLNNSFTKLWTHLFLAHRKYLSIFSHVASCRFTTTVLFLVTLLFYAFLSKHKQYQIINDSNISTHTIPRVESNIGRRTLGVRLSPDGSFVDEFSHCQQLALKWIHNISIAPLSQEETYTAYCTMWRPSFKFLLPITSSTKKQCKTLQRVFTGPFLAKMGISRSTSQTLVFVPCCHSGISIAKNWVQQGLHYLLGLLSYQDKVRNLLKVNINLLQLIIGLPDPPLTYSLPHISTLAPPSWVVILW